MKTWLIGRYQVDTNSNDYADIVNQMEKTFLRKAFSAPPFLFVPSMACNVAKGEKCLGRVFRKFKQKMEVH